MPDVPDPGEVGADQSDRPDRPEHPTIAELRAVTQPRNSPLPSGSR